jgi:glutathione S-transferase
MLILYFSPGSSSMAAHIALHEIGEPFEARPLSFAKHDHRSLEFLALNPEGKVPTLLIDGRPLTEVAGILYYLARRFPAAALWPEGDIELEAQAISWMSFIAATLHPARRRGLESAQQVYGIADRRLGAKEWALERYSIVDIHLFRLYWRMLNSLAPERSMFPNLSAHHDRMMLRDAVRKTIEIETAVGYELPS